MLPPELINIIFNFCSFCPDCGKNHPLWNYWFGDRLKRCRKCNEHYVRSYSFHPYHNDTYIYESDSDSDSESDYDSDST